MSFSGRVKEELSRQAASARHCQLAELAAITEFLGMQRREERGRLQAEIHTENLSAARKCFTLLKKTYNIRIGVSAKRNTYNKERPEDHVESGSGGKRHGSYLVIADDGLDALDHVLIQSLCCKRAFIRGAFLAAGSVSDPEKSYHFEIVCETEEKARRLQEMIGDFGVSAKITLRKKSFVLYVKEGSQIVDLLNVMEAHAALMDYENVRILKEMRNSVNRQVNCETANLGKTISAAVKQIEDIRYIQRNLGFAKLPENLAEMAELRLEQPEATLKELGEMLNPPVGKSGVNHRLRKLSVLAEELREFKEEKIL